jgi:hypothetical protein
MDDPSRRFKEEVMTKKGVTFGLALGVMIAAAAAILFGTIDSVPAQVPGTHAQPSDDTVVVHVAGADGGQFVVLVDTNRQVIGTYHINPENGKITLRSVRNYRWDFQMEEFNGAEPKPHEIRAIVEKR